MLSSRILRLLYLSSLLPLCLLSTVWSIQVLVLHRKGAAPETFSDLLISLVSSRNSNPNNFFDLHTLGKFSLRYAHSLPPGVSCDMMIKKKRKRKNKSGAYLQVTLVCLLIKLSCAVSKTGCKNNLIFTDQCHQYLTSSSPIYGSSYS